MARTVRNDLHTVPCAIWAADMMHPTYESAHAPWPKKRYYSIVLPLQFNVSGNELLTDISLVTVTDCASS